MRAPGHSIARAPRISLRIGIAAGLTAYIMWKSHPSEVWNALAGAEWRPMAGAVLLVLCDRALMAYRWVVLLCIIEQNRRPSPRAIMRIFFVSTFVGTFLPASVGGDAVRAFSISQLDVDGSDAVASVFMDRMLGVASILLMALVGLVLARDLAENRTILASLVVAGGVCVVTLLVIFSARTTVFMSTLIARLPKAQRGLGIRLLESLRRYSRYHRQLTNVLVGSVLVQVLRVLQAYGLGRGLGLDVPIEAYFAFIPLILLIMLLPVTFNGIGTSQAAFVWFFARTGVSAGPAFMLSVFFVALGIVWNLPGSVLYLLGPGRRPLASN